MSLTKRGIEAVGVDIQEMDITDAASVEKVIGEAAPDAVVSLCSLYRSGCSGGQRGNLPQGQRGRHTEYCECLQEVGLQDGLYQHRTMCLTARAPEPGSQRTSVIR